MNVPPIVVASLSIEPREGALDAVCFLVTADVDRQPMVCLLSSRQVAVDGESVSLLVRSRRTIANLNNGSRSLLHVICDHVAWSLSLALDELQPDAVDGMANVRCSVVAVEEDRVADQLEPARYLVTKALIEREGPSIKED